MTQVNADIRAIFRWVALWLRVAHHPTGPLVLYTRWLRKKEALQIYETLRVLQFAGAASDGVDLMLQTRTIQKCAATAGPPDHSQHAER